MNRCRRLSGIICWLVLIMPVLASNIPNTDFIRKIINIILKANDDTIDPTTVDLNGDGNIDIADIASYIQQLITYEHKDTLFLHFCIDGVKILNQNEKEVAVNRGEHENDIIISSSSSVNMVISASGTSSDGRICVTANAPYVLLLDGLDLTSKHASAFNSRSSEHVIIEMNEGTQNYLTDAAKYELDDISELANGCLNTMGRLDLKGKGQLTVTGKRKHAIYSKKSIHFNGGTVNVNAAESDAVHSGKYVSLTDTSLKLTGMNQDGIDADEYFEMNSGSIDIHLTADGAKGIKCPEDIEINGGNIAATASGNIVNKNGDLTYCTIMKTEGNISLIDTKLNLVHYGEGGKCLSAKKNFVMKDSHLIAELTGDGGCYTNQDGLTDYYTPRAIEADDTLAFVTGEADIHCTGIGGKCVVCDHELMIGELGSDNDKLKITLVTEGTAVVNNVEEDYREGCPKAFKSGDQLDVLSGTINVMTKGMGGEGFESKNEIWIVNGEITCDTFDDCFNGGTQIYVYGGNIYCYSQDNDGFDSNGSITIEGGNIFSASLNSINESFDTEGNTLTIKGGNILGIGGSEVNAEQSLVPFYSYRFWDDQLVQQPTQAISLLEGNFLSVLCDHQCLLSGYIPANFPKAIVTIASPSLNIHKEYMAAETDMPQGGTPYCDDHLRIGAAAFNSIVQKFTFTPEYISIK